MGQISTELNNKDSLIGQKAEILLAQADWEILVHPKDGLQAAGLKNEASSINTWTCND